MNETTKKPALHVAQEQIAAILQQVRRLADLVQAEAGSDRGVRALSALRAARQVLEKGVQS